MWFSRRRREMEQQLDAARRENQALRERCESVEAARRVAEAELASARSEGSAAAETVTAAPTAERDQPGAVGDAGAARPAAGAADGCWALLLADLARRWPAPIGDSPAASVAVVGGDMSEQLAEAVTRELERLREEVGLDAEVSVTGAIAPADPVVFLLATLDLVGALTTGCQRVVVKLEDRLDLAGEDWEGQRDELDAARSRAVAAGVEVTPVEIEGDQVHVALIPAPAG